MWYQKPVNQVAGARNATIPRASLGIDFFTGIVSTKIEPHFQVKHYVCAFEMFIFTVL